MIQNGVASVTHMFNLKEVKEVPNMLKRLRESQMMSSIFPKYSVVVFVIGLYFVAGSVLLSYYVIAAVVR
jgi:hypothetical protein